MQYGFVLLNTDNTTKKQLIGHAKSNTHHPNGFPQIVCCAFFFGVPESEIRMSLSAAEHARPTNMKIEEEENVLTMVCSLLFFFSDLTPRVPWNVFDQVCSFGLEVSKFFFRDMHAAIFYRNMHIALCNVHLAMQYRLFSSK